MHSSAARKWRHGRSWTQTSRSIPHLQLLLSEGIARRIGVRSIFFSNFAVSDAMLDEIFWSSDHEDSANDLAMMGNLTRIIPQKWVPHPRHVLVFVARVGEHSALSSRS